MATKNKFSCVFDWFIFNLIKKRNFQLSFLIFIEVTLYTDSVLQSHLSKKGIKIDLSPNSSG